MPKLKSRNPVTSGFCIEACRKGQMNPSYWDRVLQLKKEAFAYTKNPKVLQTDEWDMRAIHYLIREGNQLGRKGFFIGYGRILPEKTFLQEASLSRICIDPKFQGKGAGKALVEKMITGVRIFYSSPSKVEIKVREPLIKYYEPLGFELAGELDETYYLMSLK